MSLRIATIIGMIGVGLQLLASMFGKQLFELMTQLNIDNIADDIFRYIYYAYMGSLLLFFTIMLTKMHDLE